MGLGLGIVLIVAGLVFVTGAVNVNIGAIDETTLGWILLLAGALAVVLALVSNAQRHRRTEVVERREQR